MLKVDGADAYILIHLLHLEVLCLGAEVGAHDAVHAEHAVVGLVAEVASVAPVFLAIGGIVVDGLVHPVPDSTSHEEVRALHSVPIIYEVADGVAHGMGVFGDVEGIDEPFLLAFYGCLHPRNRGILVRTHIDDVVVALILHGARGVERLDGFVGFHEVVAGAGLIAQRPDADRGMIDVLMHHLHIACHVLVAELWHPRQRLVAVVILMALDVGFILEHDAIFVAEIIPIGVVGIMTVAHVVDVAALHQHHLFFHLFASDGVAPLRGIFVAVHALHLHGLVVEVIIAPGQSEFIVVGGGLTDFAGAETYDGADRLYHVALGVLQLCHEHISVGGFRAPGLGGGTRDADALRGIGSPCDGDFQRLLCARLGSHGGVLLAVELFFVERIAEGGSLDGLLAQILQHGVHLQRVGGLCHCHDVCHLHPRLAVEGHGAEDAGQAEHILALKEAAVALAIHFARHDVLALHEIGRDVELGSGAGVLGESHVAPIDV